jgi:DNA-binding NtrC family response regulator
MNSAVSSSPGSPPAGKAAILLVEDEVPLLDVYVAALGMEFDVVPVTNVREADALLQERAFKVVLADHLMPGETGLSFLIRAKQRFPQMQRVLVTGYLKPEVLLKSVTEGGVYRCLLKPISMVELVTVMREAVQAHDASVAGTL